ncbi:MAG: DUF192 domain-containing protein [Acidimicrobiia bacterium]|nr:DUF192 domain-containing protein [Acidimicrobiia bacterium]
MQRLAVLILGSGLALAACSGHLSNTAGLTQHRTMVVNDQPTDICLAVAATVAQQVNGLGNRASLPPKEGMAFPVATPTQESFTMKDTSFPLSIVWVGPGSQVLGSTDMSPHSSDLYPAPAPITMAVELSPQDWAPLAGTARTLSFGEACNGTIVAGRPGQAPSQF